ncbi:TRAP transporter substrate-binding protein [Gynuella sp.]|uniref:TRAP transporter substrate-binding protein n=1 Tax=Gynuella sp. TaxID=2969146 RepID=UPI003D10772A
MRNVMKPLIAGLLASLSCVSITATKWDMPTPYGDGTHHTQNIREFAAEVAEKTNGELNIVVHSGASLIKHPEIHRAVRSGQVPIGEIFMGLLGNDNPIYQVDNIPFLVSSFDGAHTLWQVTRPAVEKSLQKQGLKLLFSVPWPPQGFYTKTRIEDIGDLKGIKMRAYSATTSRLAELLEASPTTVQTPEIPQAFSTGIIDAMITSPTTGVSSQAWDYTAYYLDSQAWIPKNMVFVNARAFARLPESVQTAVMEAATAAEARGWKMAKAETDTKTAELAKNGMTVYQPSAKFASDLAAIGQIMANEWAQEMGPKGQQILSELKP